MKAYGLARLTRDPELKALPSGSTLAQFSIAWNKKVKGEDQASFMECVAWGKTGDIVVEYLTKGDPIVITSADITFEQWETDDGQKRTKHKLTVFQFEFAGSKND